MVFGLQSIADLLTVVSYRIARAFNSSGATQVVALDISKTFDRIFLSNRQLCVCLNLDLTHIISS